MHRTLSVLALAGALLVPAVPAVAGQADRGGLDTSSVNGGDRGWGNCGRNSSGGVHAPLPGSAGNGNGGHRKGDTCAQASAPAPAPVTPAPAPEAPAPAPEVPAPAPEVSPDLGLGLPDPDAPPAY